MTRRTAVPVAIVHTLGAAICAAGEIPSGHLYAHAMGKISLPTYDAAIRLLVRAGVVEKRGDLLVWKGETPSDPPN